MTGNYPSDEELKRFIAQMEKEELYAPAHLKEEILKSAGAAKQIQEKTTVTTLPTTRTQSTRVQMLTYSLKIAAGMAAAIAMLLLLPGGSTRTVEKPSGLPKLETGAQYVREITTKMNRSLTKFANYTFMEDRNNEN